MTKKTNTTKLRDEARRLVLVRIERDKVPIKSVAEECGLPYDWFRRFYNGTIPDPSVNRIEYILITLGGRLNVL